MNPLSVDVKNILETAGIGVFAATSGWAIYIGQGAETPDTLIGIFDVPAGTPQDPISIDIAPERVGTEFVRIKVRSNSYTDAWQKIKAIENELNDTTDQTVGNTYYNIIYRATSIAFDSYDEQNRAIWTQDFAAMRQTPSSSSSSSSTSSSSSGI